LVHLYLLATKNPGSPRLIDHKPKIFVAGNGPVGSWIAHELLLWNFEVSFLLSKGPPRDVSWSFVSGDVTTPHKVPGIDQLAISIPTKSPSLVIVATRANDLASLWDKQLSLLPPAKDDGNAHESPVIMICCNGWVAEEIATWSRLRPDLKFLLAVTTAGITRAPGNTFLRTDSAGKIWWGPLRSEGHTPAWEKSLPPIFVNDPAIIERARRKWLFNTAANTLAGVLKLPRNHLMIDVHRNRLRQLFDEAYDLGCELWPEWRAKAFKEPARRETLWHELCLLIRETGANENSMSRAARTGSGTAEALYLGGLAFERTGYPELKQATAQLLRDEPSSLDGRDGQIPRP
jgi:ketopantoate reductase